GKGYTCHVRTTPRRRVECPRRNPRPADSFAGRSVARARALRRWPGVGAARTHLARPHRGVVAGCRRPRVPADAARPLGWRAHPYRACARTARSAVRPPTGAIPGGSCHGANGAHDAGVHLGRNRLPAPSPGGAALGGRRAAGGFAALAVIATADARRVTSIL